MISPDQRKRYWAELHAVMEKVGPSDSTQDSGLRTQNFREAFHAQHNLPASTKDFTKKDFDEFLRACAAILKPADLKPQLRSFDQPKARLHHKILVEQAAQLKALGKADPAITIGQISVQKFHGRHFDQLSANKRPPRNEGDDERPSELEMLMFTVARTISELRQAKGWTVHELLWNAGQGKSCQCADCRRSARTVPAREPGTFGDMPGFLEDLHADNVPF